MKKALLVYTIFCMGILFSVSSYACVGGKPVCYSVCVDMGFHLDRRCCKKDSSDCLTAELPKQKCGEGEFSAYPQEQKKCCNSSLTRCNQHFKERCLQPKCMEEKK